jgi:hypothetical protein
MNKLANNQFSTEMLAEKRFFLDIVLYRNIFQIFDFTEKMAYCREITVKVDIFAKRQLAPACS